MRADGAPEDEERTAKFAGDVVFQVGEIGGVFHEPVGIGMQRRGIAERGYWLRLALGREVTPGLRRPTMATRVAPIANFVHVGGDEEIDAKAGRKDGGEIEGLRENANDSDGLIVEIHGAAEDERITGELALPERIGEKRDGCSAFLCSSGRRCGR